MRQRPGRETAEFAQHRVARDEAHRAAERAGAVERALRTAQHLDPLDVAQQEVGENRRLVDIGRDRRDRGGRVVAQRVAIDIEAANPDLVDRAGIAEAPVDHRDAGDRAQQFGAVEGLRRLDLVAAHRGDVVGHVDHALLPPRGGNGDDRPFVRILRRLAGVGVVLRLERRCQRRRGEQRPAERLDRVVLGLTGHCMFPTHLIRKIFWSGSESSSRSLFGSSRSPSSAMSARRAAALSCSG